MGNTRIPQQDLKYKLTGRRDPGRPRINGGTKFNFKGRKQTQLPKPTEVQKKKQKKTYICYNVANFGCHLHDRPT